MKKIRGRLIVGLLLIVVAALLTAPSAQGQAAGMERARLTWDTATDIDLHVWDEAGNEASYVDPNGIPNATLSTDNTTGQGPEFIVDSDAASGRTFTFGACYYSGTEPTNAELVVTDPDGTQRTLNASLNAPGDGKLMTVSPSSATPYDPPAGDCTYTPILQEEPPPEVTPPPSDQPTLPYAGSLEDSDSRYWGRGYRLKASESLSVYGLGTPTGQMKGYTKSWSSVRARDIRNTVEIALYVKGGYSSLRPHLNYEGEFDGEPGVVNSFTGETMWIPNTDNRVWRNKNGRVIGTVSYYKGALSRQNARVAGFSPGSNGWPLINWFLTEKAVTKVKVSVYASVGACSSDCPRTVVETSDSLKR